MSLTRNSLKGMGLADEVVSAIIEMHTESTDALKAQRDEFKADAEKLAIVQKELDELKNNGNDWQSKYEKEHMMFEAFKTELAEKEAKATKSNAYKQLLKQAGVIDSKLEAVLKISDLSDIKMTDGKIDDSEKILESIKDEWKDFIVETRTDGANTQTPPNNSGTKMTKSEIMAIKDSAERQKAIAENIDLFRR